MELEKLKIDRSKPARRRRRGLPGWLKALVFLAVVGGAGWLFRGRILEEVDRFRLPLVRVVQVVKSHPAALGAVRGTASNGYIVARVRAALSADTPGRIVEMLVEEGSVVKKGDVVARLYSDEYAAAVRQAEADLEAAQATLARNEADLVSSRSSTVRLEARVTAADERVSENRAALELAKLNHKRTAELVADKILSERELDVAKSELDQARARLDSTQAEVEAARAEVVTSRSTEEVAAADVEVARARVGVAQAALELARATLEKTEVRAPFDGVVVLKDAEVGEVVSPNSQGGSSARGSVCTMVDFASLEVQANVPETNLAAVEVGAPANIYLDAWPDVAYGGRVSRIWPTADRQKATVEVRVKFDHPDERLRPEMGVRVVFAPGAEGAGAAQPAAAGEPQVLVPSEALVRIDGRSGVFVVERDLVRFQTLELGPERSGRVAIRSGLEGGERIVLAPPPRLQSGDRVRIQEG